MKWLVPIVEGYGEVSAVPSLLLRIARRANPMVDLRVKPPIRVKAGSFLNDSLYFSKYLRLAAEKAAEVGGQVFIILDCEDSCPAQQGPAILSQAQSVRSDINYIVCLVRREYETWFLAAAESIRGKLGLPSDLSAPPNFEAIRDAKGWLSSRMSMPYDPNIHQLDLTRLFDLGQAATSQSFARLVAKIEDIVSK
jgi:hypothetical protein